MGASLLGSRPFFQLAVSFMSPFLVGGPKFERRAGRRDDLHSANTVLLRFWGLDEQKLFRIICELTRDGAEGSRTLTYE